jgi:hypothetical protein
MVDELFIHLPNFPGQKGCVCCFDHILNLVAKCILQLFDSKVIDEVVKEVWESESESKFDGNSEVIWGNFEKGDDKAEDEDTLDTPRLDHEAIKEAVKPVSSVLHKVSSCLQSDKAGNRLTFSNLQLQKLSYKVIYSTTIVLPAWRSICAELKLKVCQIPHDIST